MDPVEEILCTDKPAFRSFRVTLWGNAAILARSRGEVQKPETVNYRTFQPEKGGLTCQTIFGKLKRCSCGKESRTDAGRRSASGGTDCSACGKVVPPPKSRSRRFGHVALAAPVGHPWFRQAIAGAARLSAADLQAVLLRERWVVTEQGSTLLPRGAVIDERTMIEMADSHGDTFRAGYGAESILSLVGDAATPAGPVSAMFFRAFPILPPALRPMVPLQGGRFATSDLLDLYRRVINRNNRLRRLLELNAPEIILRNEARMLHEAVDGALDNEGRDRVFTGPDRRVLRSLGGVAGGPEGIARGLAEFDRAIVAGTHSLQVPRRFRRRVTMLRGLGLNLVPP